MLSKIVAFFLSAFMFFSSIIPGLFKHFGVGDKVNTTITDVGKYVENNLPVFDEMFKKLGVAFKATAIEEKIPCTVLLPDGSSEETTYVDFNGNFGYMILSADHCIYAYKSEGDFQVLKSADRVYYSLTDGFGYMNADNEFVSYELEDMKADESHTYDYIKEYFNYVSQDGSLQDTDEYIKKQYGDGYKVSCQYELKDFDYTTQIATSVYNAITEDGSYISEGNCSLQAIYTLLSYYQKKAGSAAPRKYSSLPSRHMKSIIFADRDPFFGEFKDNVNYKIEGYNRKTGICTGLVVPTLYKTIRNICIENYGYKTGGTKKDNFKNIVKYVFDTYNIEPTPLTEHVDVKAFQTVIAPHIEKGLPILWSTSDSSTYGSHTTVVTGYKVYTKFVDVDGFKILTDKIILLKLNDNWSTQGNYFDYTRYNFGTGTIYTLDD